MTVTPTTELAAATAGGIEALPQWPTRRSPARHLGRWTGNIAFTARGRARIVQEPMAAAPDYTAVAIDVHQIDDHRQAAFLVEAGVDRRWLDERERDALGESVLALTELAWWSEAR